MPRILIDCTKIDFRRQPTGIPRVVLKYIEEGYIWGQLSGHEVIPVVPSTEGLWLCRPIPGANAPQSLLELSRFSERYELNRPVTFNGEVVPTRDVAPPHLIDSGPEDILFSPSYWHDNDPGIYEAIKATGCKIAILVHDILPITQAPFYRAPWRYQFAAAVLQAIRYADALYCVSRTTKEAVEAFAAQRGVPVPPIGIAYNGFEPLLSTTAAKNLSEGLLAPHVRDVLSLRALASDGPLLMVGSIEPKKGHIPVIKTLEALWATGYSRNLVIIGRTGWMESEIVDYIVNAPSYGSRLFWLTDIDDFDLAYAYSKCHALVFASLDEGFGIPMIEAAKFRKPIVVLSTKISNEILGPYGLYFDEADSLMARLMELEDVARYSEACEQLDSFDWPSWADTVPLVLDDLIENLIMPCDATANA